MRKGEVTQMSAQQQQPITGFHDLPLEKLDEAPFNPRTHFDVQKLADLQASIEARGVLVPLLVRPHLNRYQILCGARRYRAAKAVGLPRLPCKVVLLNDPEALEVAVIENLQREDVHPLEEAAGFRALLEHGYDVPAIAAKIGKDETYIYRRLALLKLSTKAREALEDEKITVAHAALLTPLSEERQNEAVAWLLKAETHLPGRGYVKALPPAATLRTFIESELMLKLKAAPFPIVDAELLPKAGACSGCMKRTSAQAALFEETPKDDHCLDKGCWHQKTNAHIAAQQKTAEANGEKLLKLATEHVWRDEDRKAGLLGNSEYTAVGKKRCPHVERGIVVRGEKAGQILEVCRKNGCEVHRPSYGGVVRGERTFAEIWVARKKDLDERIERDTTRKMWYTLATSGVFSGQRLDDIELFKQLAHALLKAAHHEGRKEVAAAIGLVPDPKKKRGWNLDQELEEWLLKLPCASWLSALLALSMVSYQFHQGEINAWSLERKLPSRAAVRREIAEPLLKEFEAKKAKAEAKEKAAKAQAKKTAKPGKAAKAKPPKKQRKPAAEPDEEDES